MDEIKVICTSCGIEYDPEPVTINTRNILTMGFSIVGVLLSQTSLCPCCTEIFKKHNTIMDGSLINAVRKRRNTVYAERNKNLVENMGYEVIYRFVDEQDNDGEVDSSWIDQGRALEHLNDMIKDYNSTARKDYLLVWNEEKQSFVGEKYSDYFAYVIPINFHDRV